MNKWLIAAIALMCALLPCGITCIKGRIMERFVGLEMATIISAIILMLLAMGFHRPAFFDLAITLSLLSLPSSLLFVHYLGRWR